MTGLRFTGAPPPPVTAFAGDPLLGQRRSAATLAANEAHLDAHVLAAPVFAGPPPFSPQAHAAAGLAEARRRRAIAAAAAQPQGGDPDQVGVSTRNGESLSEIVIPEST